MIKETDNFEIIKFYSERLSFLWEKYLTGLNLLISLSGGTMLIFFNSVRLSELKNYKMVEYIVIGILFSGASLLFSVVWRFVSQHFMEKEVLGSSLQTDTYFKLSNIKPATSSHHKQTTEPFYRLLYRVLPTLTGISLSLAWLMILIFVLVNS